MELLWKQPSARREEYELRAGDEVLATLRWPKSWGSLAEAEVAEGRWTFKRVGFWRTRGTLRVAGDEDDIGTLEARWTGNGTLTLASGESYGWESTNLWGTRYGWSDSRGTELVRFGATASLLREEAAVELSPRASALSDLPLLVLYGWYLLVMHNRDAAGATAATAGGASSS